MNESCVHHGVVGDTQRPGGEFIRRIRRSTSARLINVLSTVVCRFCDPDSGAIGAIPSPSSSSIRHAHGRQSRPACGHAHRPAAAGEFEGVDWRGL